MDQTKEHACSGDPKRMINPKEEAYVNSHARECMCKGTARSRRANILIIVLAVILVVVMTISFMLGKYPIDPGQVWSLLIAQVVPLDQTWTNYQATIFFGVRLPRLLLAVLVGCALSIAGAAYQGIFQNPLVSPDILGASQGAAFGAALSIMLGASSVGISIGAFIVSMLAVALVIVVSQRARCGRLLGVVLAGIMVSSLFSAAVSFIKLVADPTDQLPQITYWLMGSFTSASMNDVLWVIIPIALGCVVLFLMRWRIDILTMGDDEARTMGVNVGRTRLIIIIAATLVTAASVSVSGIIGWVGLVVPHLARMLVGCDYRKLIPASMLLGSGFLLVVDDVSRLVGTAEIPIGILTAFVGAPFFLYLITRKDRFE